MIFPIIQLPNVAATSAKAVTLGALLTPGDVVLLNGPVGVGKTHFARALIQSLLSPVEDVPSPTFTLVQTYDTRAGEIWHADLYRLTTLDEIEELGLTEAFETAICLIEWPERLGPLTPASALTIDITMGANDGARILRPQWTDTKWDDHIREWAK